MPLKLMVVIPTYNEAENLPRLASLLLELPLDLRLLVVDDNSSDGTGRLADELATSHPGRIDVLHRPSKAGLRSAYLQGFRRALDAGAEAVAQMDADFSHEPAVLIRMVGKLQDCDLVIGSRYIEGGSVDRNWPAWRKRLSAFGNVYSRAILGFAVRDSTSGYRLWRAETLRGMPLERVLSSGYVFQVEMAYLASSLEYRVCEVPIYFPDRQVGKSKMSFGIQAEAAMRVFRVWWDYRDIRRAGRRARHQP
jgi:dolichol-phosphate mannosyltransferase